MLARSENYQHVQRFAAAVREWKQCKRSLFGLRACCAAWLDRIAKIIWSLLRDRSCCFVHVCEGVILDTWAQGMAEGVGKSVLHVGFRRKAVGHWVSKVRSSDRLDNGKLWRECANACARPRTIQMKFRSCFRRHAVYFFCRSRILRFFGTSSLDGSQRNRSEDRAPNCFGTGWVRSVSFGRLGSS